MPSEVIIFQSVLVIFSALIFMLFLIQALIRKMRIENFIGALFFGLCASSLGLMNELGLFADHYLAMSFQLSFYAFEFVGFFLFLERMVTIHGNPVRLTIVLFFLILDVISVWLIYIFKGRSEVTNILWLFADIGYNGLGIYVYLVRGGWLYWKAYRYTKEKKSLLVYIAFMLLGIGFILVSIADWFDFHPPQPIWAADIDTLSGVFQALGLIVLTVTFAVNINYIYRLPFDIHILMVVYKSGNTIFVQRLKTKRRLEELEPHLVSGFLSALNSLFGTIFEKRTYIQKIEGKNTKILFETGRYATAIIIAERVSYHLERSLDRYLKDFEDKFHQLLNKREPNMRKFEVGAQKLLRSHFPFLMPENSSFLRDESGTNLSHQQ